MSLGISKMKLKDLLARERVPQKAWKKMWKRAKIQGSRVLKSKRKRKALKKKGGHSQNQILQKNWRKL